MHHWCALADLKLIVRHWKHHKCSVWVIFDSLWDSLFSSMKLHCCSAHTVNIVGRRVIKLKIYWTLSLACVLLEVKNQFVTNFEWKRSLSGHLLLFVAECWGEFRWTVTDIKLNSFEETISLTFPLSLHLGRCYLVGNCLDGNFVQIFLYKNFCNFLTPKIFVQIFLSNFELFY